MSLGLCEIFSGSDLGAYARFAGEMPLPPYFGRKAICSMSTAIRRFMPKSRRGGQLQLLRLGCTLVPSILMS